MAPNTTIGAASIVGGGGEDLPETLARKITNDAVARIRSLANEHGRNADWAESAVRDAASVDADRGGEHGSAGRRHPRGRHRRAVRGHRHRRARGRPPYEFNGEPLPDAVRPPDHRSRDEPRAGVPAPAQRPEHRVPAVHDRLLRDRGRALPPELLLRHPRRDRDRRGAHRLERAAAQRRRPAAGARWHRSARPRGRRGQLRPADGGWDRRDRARRVRAVDRRGSGRVRVRRGRQPVDHRRRRRWSASPTPGCSCGR